MSIVVVIILSLVIFVVDMEDIERLMVKGKFFLVN